MNQTPLITKIIKWALLANLIWSLLLATFGAGMLYQILGLAGAVQAGGILALLAWFIVFAAVFIKGAVFLAVLGLMALLLTALYLALTKKNCPDKGSCEDDQDGEQSSCHHKQGLNHKDK